MLPPLDDFVRALRESVGWLIGEGKAALQPEVMPGGADEQRVPRLRFAGAPQLGVLGQGAYARRLEPSAYSSAMDRVRYAARNRLLARMRYHGVARLVEPYSLRVPGIGNLLLYVFERDGVSSQSITAFKVAEISRVEVTNTPFDPRCFVEL